METRHHPKGWIAQIGERLYHNPEVSGLSTGPVKEVFLPVSENLTKLAGNHQEKEKRSPTKLTPISLRHEVFGGQAHLESVAIGLDEYTVPLLGVLIEGAGELGAVWPSVRALTVPVVLEVIALVALE